MLGSTIQREIADMIMRDIDDPRLPSIVSITRVKVAADLSTADVFVTVMGTPGQQTAALNALKHSAGMMRGRLTKNLSLRSAPFIKFHLDDKLKKELEMMEILQKVADETAEAERRRTAAASGGQETATGAPGDGNEEEQKNQ
jgi:ribosome-binding factor A